MTTARFALLAGPCVLAGALLPGPLLLRICLLGLGVALIGFGALLRRASAADAVRPVRPPWGALAGLLLLAAALRAVGLDSGLC